MTSSAGPGRSYQTARIRPSGGPIPKFAQTRGTLAGELRNQGTTGKFTVPAPHLNPKFAIELAARYARTSGSGRRCDTPSPSSIRHLGLGAIGTSVQDQTTRTDV